MIAILMSICIIKVNYSGERTQNAAAKALWAKNEKLASISVLSVNTWVTTFRSFLAFENDKVEQNDLRGSV